MGGGSPSRAASTARWVAIGAPVALATVLGFTHRWIADDGYIYLRIVDQVFAGNGPVFNAGERVEAYTSPAWVALLVVADLVLPIAREWIVVLLGLAATAVGIAAAMAGALHLSRRGDQDGATGVVVPAGVLVAIAPFGSWLWFTSGLETSLTWAWLGACLLVLARWASAAEPGRLGRGAAVLAGLGWLVRPELVVFSALFLVAVLAGERGSTTWRQRLGTAATFVAIPVAYQLFRMGYFGMLVANTAVAKEGTSFLWDRGLRYLRDFVDPYWMWLPVLVVVAAGIVPLARRAAFRQRLVIGAFLAGACITGVQAVVVGGDYLHGRFFMPSLFALCAPVAAVRLERRFAGLAVLGPWAIAVLLAARPPQADRGLLTGAVVPPSFGGITLADQGWDEGGPARQWYRGDGLYLAESAFAAAFSPATFEPAPWLAPATVLPRGVGIVAYAVGPDVHVVDPHGLANIVGSHFDVTPNQDGLSGHDKPAPPPWLLAQIAAPGRSVARDQLRASTHSVLIPPADGAELDEQVALARDVLACGVVRDLVDAATEDLGIGRIVGNLFGSFGNTFVRIPPDPAAAHERFC